MLECKWVGNGWNRSAAGLKGGNHDARLTECASVCIFDGCGQVRGIFDRPFDRVGKTAERAFYHYVHIEAGGEIGSAKRSFAPGGNQTRFCPTERFRGTVAAAGPIPNEGSSVADACLLGTGGKTLAQAAFRNARMAYAKVPHRNCWISNGIGFVSDYSLEFFSEVTSSTGFVTKKIESVRRSGRVLRFGFVADNCALHLYKT